jgi:membrane protein DedA with SNARE-associated domain
MHQIHELLRQYGDWFYLVTFLWTAVEGETFVIFAGLAAQKNLLNVYLLFLAAWLGSMTGDQIFFFLGRRYGVHIIEHMPHLKPKVDRVLGWLEKYAVIFILSYRFMYGLRNVSGIAVGLSHLPWKKFAVLNAIAAFVWAFAFVGFGYAFSKTIDELGHRREEQVNYDVRNIMLTVLGLFAIIIIAKLVSIRRERRRREAVDKNAVGKQP